MPPCDEKDMYELICEKRFDELKAMCRETNELLRGHNGEPGMVDNVRSNTKAFKRLFAAFVFCGGAIFIQIIRGAWNWLETLFTQ